MPYGAFGLTVTALPLAPLLSDGLTAEFAGDGELDGVLAGEDGPIVAGAEVVCPALLPTAAFFGLGLGAGG